MSRPLAFSARALRAERDNLAGEVVVEVVLQNQSRLPKGGVVLLATPQLPGYTGSREIEALEAGRSRALRFTVAGLEPLDLIGGNVTLDFTVTSDRVLQDRLTHRLPDTARDRP